MSRLAASIRLLECDAFVHEIHARIPFRYGKACLTAAPVLTVEASIELQGGRRAKGLASDCLPPRWFDKDPEKSYRAQVEDQIASYRLATAAWLEAGSSYASPFDLWTDASERVRSRASPQGINALTASFGSSLVERAVIDAACRAEGLSFFDALRAGRLGLAPASLPSGPRSRIACRHTVGLADPLTEAEIPSNERLDDGLPQSLEQSIDRYGLRWFKLKVAGDHDRDLERLLGIARVLSVRCAGGFRVSLDGNEQYGDPEGLEVLVEALRRHSVGRELLERTAYIEQPLPREIALDPTREKDIRRLAELKPLIIDESDDRPQAFREAAALGYRGTSHKNCKGVFKSFLTLDRLDELRRETGDGGPWLLTAEDLANTPVVPLQEDLATIAALGIEHAERNGHHYFRGLDWLPASERRAALRAHPDLYEERDGGIFLRIEDGEIRCESIQCPGFGYGAEIALAERVPVEEWSFERLGGEG